MELMIIMSLSPAWVDRVVSNPGKFIVNKQGTTFIFVDYTTTGVINSFDNIADATSIATYTFTNTNEITLLKTEKINGINYVLTGFSNGEIYRESVLIDSVAFNYAYRDIAYSIDHARLVIVGDNSQLAYIDATNFPGTNALISIPNGFNPTSDILGVHYDEDDNLFIACNSVGQICRSTNGTA